VAIVLKSGSLNLLEPSGTVQPCRWIEKEISISILQPGFREIADFSTEMVE
jgi:hypothetical protein